MKILGLSLCVIPILIIGFYFSYETSYRIKDLREMKKILIFMKNEIVFLKTPLKELMESIKNKSSLDYLFENFINELELTHGNMESKWERALNKSVERFYFKKEDIDIFYSFGKCLGRSQEAELSIVDNIIQYIDLKILELDRENQNKIKLYKSLGILLSLTIVIIFL